MDLLIASLADRPDLAPGFAEFPDSWPEFMYHDVVSDLLFDRLMRAHPESYLIAVDPAEPDRPVARACALPFTWPNVDELPRGGYDQVLLGGAADLISGAVTGPIAAALEITVRPDRRSAGLSTRMLDALRHALAGRGFTSLVAPVRPTEKYLYPHESMAAYVQRVRPDGLPADPWLRTHVRVGATVVGIASTSMTIAGSVEEWRRWTGLPFDADGPVVVPFGLAPVHCDLTRGIAVYVEPNVWVHHQLTTQE